MSDEKSQQQTSTESTVAGAAKTGKAISLQAPVGAGSVHAGRCLAASSAV